MVFGPGAIVSHSRRSVVLPVIAVVASKRRLKECEVTVVTVKYEDLSMAFDFVSSAAPMEHQAFISLDTGTIHWISELAPLEDEMPEDFESSDRYLEIPHKNDLDLGKNLALEFVADRLPAQYAEVDGFFRSRGAYGRFKDLLSRERCLEDWYTFEVESTATALKNWCKENDVQLIET